jgi:phosphatidate cytidylyltransferase
MVFLIILSLYLSKWMFAGMLLVVVIFGLWEFYTLVSSESIKPHKLLGTISGALWFCISALIAIRGSFTDLYFLVILPIPFIFLPFIREIWAKNPNPLHNVALTILGLIYIPVPLSMLVFMQGPMETRLLGMPAFLLGYLLITWVYDTGAYLFGKRFGKTKFFERISPKKTWEGTISGAIAALLITAGLWLLVPDIGLIDWAILLLIVLVMGTFGDLVESLFKRSLNIKDSGTILPGHGGILDRFDTIFISAPFVFLYFFLRNGI